MSNIACKAPALLLGRPGKTRTNRRHCAFAKVPHREDDRSGSGNLSRAGHRAGSGQRGPHFATGRQMSGSANPGVRDQPDFGARPSRNLAAAGLNGRVELFAGSAADLLSELGKGGAENQISSSPAFRWEILAEKRLSLSLTPSTRPSAKAECTSNSSIHCWTARRSEPGSRTCALFPHS